MKYMLVYAGDISGLQQLVNEKLNDGWRPAGGVETWDEQHNDGYGNIIHNPWFAQALKQGGRAK